MAALEYDGSGIFNCGSGAATSFNDLVKIINEMLHGTNKPDDWIWPPEYIDNPYEATYQTFTQCDMNKAHQKLGFVPRYHIRDGIKEYVEYIKKT